MKRYGFIYNPGSGNRPSDQKTSALKEKVRHFREGRLFLSETKEDIPDIVQGMMTDFDIIVACGGDGTIREIAAPLINTDKCLGIIPMGSGNDLIKSLNIPKKLGPAFRMLQNGRISNIDVGRCNEFIFLNTLGFGFDGLANKYAGEYQSFSGMLKYLLAALKANLHRCNIDVAIGNKPRADYRPLLMATVANGRVEGGSFRVAPQASTTDGQLNFITIEPISKWILPFVLPLAWLGKLHFMPHYQSTCIKSVRLNFKRNVFIHADGEVLFSHKKDFEINVLPEALKVIADLGAI